LLAIACIAIVGLTVAMVVVATSNSGSANIQRSAIRAAGSTGTNPYSYYGGHEEGNPPLTAVSVPPTTRYDGGPEEGTRGPEH
jgi:hypothetical protein